MKMKNKKLGKFAAILLAVLSLLTSSVAACACSHHQSEVETAAPSCHEHSAQSSEMPMSPEYAATFDAADECVCIKSAPRVFAKSEIVKIEKQAAAISPNVFVSVKLNAPIVKAETAYFIKPSYLSDSFYNLKSPRAPPVL